ncbi:MAG: hypothetical protein H6Q20_1944 [Bacteroidetes bacterium]|jgi:hypothetical protein|nr:hypothetical protein [Bacteroidota bacterium]
MKCFDEFYIITYFILKKLGRDEDAAKWSAMLHTGAITGISLITIVGIISVFSARNFANILWNNILYSMLAWFFCCFLFYLRYFVIKSNLTADKKYKKLRENNFKNKVIWYLVINVVIAVLFVASAIINKNVHG